LSVKTCCIKVPFVEVRGGVNGVEVAECVKGLEGKDKEKGVSDTLAGDVVGWSGHDNRGVG
jgi:hypothetical protein